MARSGSDSAARVAFRPTMNAAIASMEPTRRSVENAPAPRASAAVTSRRVPPVAVVRDRRSIDLEDRVDGVRVDGVARRNFEGARRRQAGDERKEAYHHSALREPVWSSGNCLATAPE